MWALPLLWAKHVTGASGDASSQQLRLPSLQVFPGEPQRSQSRDQISRCARSSS